MSNTRIQMGIYSTEPQARKVLENKRGAKKPVASDSDDGYVQGQQTAPDQKSLQKTKKQGNAERDKLRKKQRERMANTGLADASSG